jgi:hypothetical protein
MSSVASPPETPIEIDGGIAYNYVIAQQGATSMSVDTDADFDFTTSFASPAGLRLTFTGTVTGVAQYKTVTLRFRVPEGETLHTPSFRILPTSATQRVPDILTKKSLHVRQAQPVDFNIETISPPEFCATGLPDVCVNSTNGRIQHRSSGFHTVTPGERRRISLQPLFCIRGRHRPLPAGWLLFPF